MLKTPLDPIFTDGWRAQLRTNRYRVTRAHNEKRQRKRVRWRTYTPDSTISVLAELHRRQGGVCANPSCNQAIAIMGRRRALDRDPQSGAVYGLLCKACSMALANVHRDPSRLLGLVAYLQACHRCNNL